MAWLGGRDEVDRELSRALGEQPSQRDETLSRMADVLQATAQGLGQEAAAVWAGVPNRVLEGWLRKDPAFAAAVRSAAALADAHGITPGGEPTPAMIRVVLVALSRGTDWPTAARTAGFTLYRLRRLWRTSPSLVQLANTARMARPRLPRGPAPASGRPGPAGRPAREQGYRLVRLNDPAQPPPHPEDE
ncbi:hypothetical protein ACIQU5_24865 [Streptomyces sp. NPDC090306]|uniref:hypothetical protein n=1 Tax=Streptomyces sp. NPDC090306 TaxID=3365961 RepID=UPI00380D4959